MAVYVRWDWFKNSTFCYPSTIGVSAGPNQAGVEIGVGCSSGWNAYGNNIKSTYIQDSSWWFGTAKKSTDPSSNPCVYRRESVGISASPLISVPGTGYLASVTDGVLR
jgi:hypothetical protein